MKLNADYQILAAGHTRHKLRQSYIVFRPKTCRKTGSTNFTLTPSSEHIVVSSFRVSENPLSRCHDKIRCRKPSSALYSIAPKQTAFEIALFAQYTNAFL